MYKFAIAGTVFVATIEAHMHPINDDIVNEIRQKATTWEPMDPLENPLGKMSHEQVRGLLGTIIPPNDMEFDDP